MKYLSLLCCVVFLMVACQKTRQTASCNSADGAPDYFEFGYSGGISGASRTFVIQRGMLYERDTMQPPRPASDYNTAYQLICSFPAYLTTHPDQHFGCTGCADQLIIHINTSRAGVPHSWLIDTDFDQLPAALKPYAQLCCSTINNL